MGQQKLNKEQKSALKLEKQVSLARNKSSDILLRSASLINETRSLAADADNLEFKSAASGKLLTSLSFVHVPELYEKKEKLKVVFFDIGEYNGHITPTLELVRLFVSKGHTVYYFVTESAYNRVERYGAIAKPYHEAFEVHGQRVPWNVEDASIQFVEGLGRTPPTEMSQGHVFFTMLPLSLQLLESGLIERVAPLAPDLIVSDAMYPWSNVIAHCLNIPIVTSCSSTYFSREGIDQMMGFLREIDYQQDCTALLKEKYNFDFDPASVYCNYSDFTIVWTTEDFDEAAKADTTGRVHFFGPSFPPLVQQGTPEEHFEEEDFGIDIDALKQKKANGETIIFSSMGTVCGQFECTPDSLPVIKSVVEAFKDRKNTTVVLAYGQNFDKKRLPECPSNFIMNYRVPQKTILGFADVFISHMGNNSSNEAVFMGCPLVCIPAFGDQTANALRAVALGLGAIIPNPWAPDFARNLDYVTPKVVKEKVEWVLKSDDVKRACAEMKKKHRAKHGYLHSEAVDDIQEYVIEWRSTHGAKKVVPEHVDASDRASGLESSTDTATQSAVPQAQASKAVQGKTEMAFVTAKSTVAEGIVVEDISATVAETPSAVNAVPSSGKEVTGGESEAAVSIGPSTPAPARSAEEDAQPQCCLWAVFNRKSSTPVTTKS
eukprot:scaffold2886_cov398-Prasinococcus_capsulatus_cf.AAC.1